MSDEDEDEQHRRRTPARVGERGPRPKACQKDYDKLVKVAWDAGWRCVRKPNGYVQCFPPPGSPPPRPGDPYFVQVPCTPSKQGTLNITKRKFRRFGLDL